MIEVYDALCLREPWLELILLGVKTLETRTKCMFHDARHAILASSKQVDKRAWDDPTIGGRLDADAKARAIAGLGKLRGSCRMGGFVPGVPGMDDAGACIAIHLSDGRVRHVSRLTEVRRVVEVPTRRVRVRDGVESIVLGASQGLFHVAKSDVRRAA